MWQLALYHLFFLLLYACFVHIAHKIPFFYYTKALLRCDANTETVHRQLLQLVAVIRADPGSKVMGAISVIIGSQGL